MSEKRVALRRDVTKQVVEEYLITITEAGAKAGWTPEQVAQHFDEEGVDDIFDGETLLVRSTLIYEDECDSDVSDFVVEEEEG